jgi:TusA-related sulfurtransferase
LEIFSDQIEQGESLKALIDNYETNNNFDEIMETYIKLDAIKKREKDNNEISLQ